MDSSLTTPVIATLEQIPSILLPLVAEVPPDIVTRRPAPAKWSAHEHACHLAGVQPMFFDRLDLMLSQDNPAIEPYFPDVADEEGALLSRDLSAEMRRFEKDRRKLVGLLKGLRPDEWDRTAIHGEYNRYSVFILFRHVAMHDMLHAYRVEELLLRKEWP